MQSLQISSDLMQTFRPIRPACEEKRMQAVFQDGIRAFLSITDEGRLFVTSEKNESETGWQRTDISAGICRDCGQNSKVLTFAINTDRNSSTPVLAAVVSENSKQHVYVSLKGSVTNPAWMPVNLPEEIKTMKLHDIWVSSYCGQAVLSIYYEKPNGSIERYCAPFSESGSYQLTLSPLPTDFLSITDCKMGRSASSRVEGTYTLGTSRQSNQLLFTPAYNYYDHELAPTSYRLSLPCKADAVSVIPSLETQGGTDLFVCGDGCIHWFSSKNQDDLAKPVQIAVSPHFYDVRQMFSLIFKGRVYIWLRNESKYVCYLFADCNNISNPDAWSCVSVLKEGISYFYPFCEDDSKAIFAYTKNGEGILGYEDQETGLWSYNTVFSEPDSQKAVPVTSYITMIKTPQPFQEIFLASKGKQTFDINGSIYLLKDNPVCVKSSCTGDIRIIDLSQSAHAAPVYAWIKGESEKIQHDPSKCTTEKLFLLSDKKTLSDAVIKSQNGQTDFLVPRDVSQEAIEAAANALSSLNKSRSDLNGSKTRYMNSTDPVGVHLRIDNGQLTQVSQQSARVFKTQMLCSESPSYQCEDVLGCLRSLSVTPPSDGLVDVIIDFFKDAWHFVVKIGEKVMSFVLDCVEKIVSCAVEVFRFIKVTIEKIIDFLKYVFDIDDIIMAKDAIKKILNIGQLQIKNDIIKLKGYTQEAFDFIDKNILDWADIDDIGDVGQMPLEDLPSHVSNEPYLNDVHANYLTNLVAENIDAVDIDEFKNSAVLKAIPSRIDTLVDNIEELYESEKEAIENLINRFQQEFFSDETIKSMDLITILKKLSAIISSFVIEGMSGIVNFMFDLLVEILDQIFVILNKNIYIPCVSEFLEFCGIHSFSFMDILCFLPAFTGTVMSKIIVQRPMISKAAYDKIMQTDMLCSTAGFNAVQKTAFEKDAEIYASLKAVSGCASILECVFAPLDFANEHQKVLYSAIATVLAGIDGAAYAASLLLSTPPLDGQFAKTPQYILTAIKYFPFVGKGVSFYYNIKKETKKAENWRKVFAIVYACTSTISIVGNCIYLGMACNKKNVPHVEKTAYILDTVSLIPDNLRNVSDGVLECIKPKQFIPFCIALTVRSVFGLCYSALQISDCAYTLSNKN